MKKHMLSERDNDREGGRKREVYVEKERGESMYKCIDRSKRTIEEHSL